MKFLVDKKALKIVGLVDDHYPVPTDDFLELFECPKEYLEYHFELKKDNLNTFFVYTEGAKKVLLSDLKVRVNLFIEYRSGILFRDLEECLASIYPSCINLLLLSIKSLYCVKPDIPELSGIDKLNNYVASNILDYYYYNLNLIKDYYNSVLDEGIDPFSVDTFEWDFTNLLKDAPDIDIESILITLGKINDYRSRRESP